MREFVKKWDLSAIYQIALVILDVCFINLCSVAALLVRFELSAVPVEYWESVRSMMIPNTIVTIGIFTVCRLYRSLWRFASAKELLYIGEACIGSFLFNAAAYFLTYKEIYRSYFVIYTIGLLSLCQNDLSKQCSWRTYAAHDDRRCGRGVQCRDERT